MGISRDYASNNGSYKTINSYICIDNIYQEIVIKKKKTNQDWKFNSLESSLHINSIFAHCANADMETMWLRHFVFSGQLHTD